jgi:hypothetical protein
VKRIALAAAALAALARTALAFELTRGEAGSRTVATVAGEKITREPIELAVEHFHEEADAEGRPFPGNGSKQYRRVERVALGLLIDRAAIEAAAAKLGVHVTDAQVDARAGAPSGEGEEGDSKDEADAAFRRATAHNALITEAVSRKLTAGINVSPARVRAYYRAHRALYGTTPLPRVAPAIRSQLLSARKNALLARWLAKVRAGEPKPKLD